MKGAQAEVANTEQTGSKGSALGGSRAEPWPYFPSLGSPGPETDMRSIAPRALPVHRSFAAAAQPIIEAGHGAGMMLSPN